MFLGRIRGNTNMFRKRTWMWLGQGRSLLANLLKTNNKEGSPATGALTCKQSLKDQSEIAGAVMYRTAQHRQIALLGT